MNKKTQHIVTELGRRLKNTRLNANISQKQLADIIGKSRTAIERAEKGKCNLSTFISILVALDADAQIDLFLPESPLSPVMLAKAHGKKRQRASVAKENKDKYQDDIGW